MSKDPVCGRNVQDIDGSIRSVHGGQTYHFCSEKCKQEFERDPASYVPRDNRADDLTQDIVDRDPGRPR